MLSRYIGWFLLSACVLLSTACGMGDAARADELRDMVREGHGQYDAGDYTSALATMHNAIADTALMDPEDYVTAFNVLGNIHLAYTDYADALRNYEKAYVKSKMLGHEMAEMRMLINMALTSCLDGDRESGERYGRILADMKVADRATQVYFIRLLDAYMQKIFDDTERGVSSLKGVMAYVDSAKLAPRHKLTPAIALYEYYENAGRLDSAMRYLAMYDSMASEHHLSNLMVDCRRAYMRVYTRMGDKEKALESQDDYFRFQDSLMNQARYLSINSQYQDERHRQSQKKIDDLKLTMSLQQVIIAVLVLSALAAGLIFYSHGRIKRMNLHLYRRNTEIAELEEAAHTAHEAEGRAAPGADRELYDRIVAEMEDNAPYCNPDFTLALLAEMMQSNTKYVSQAINVFSGSNFRSFVNKYRVGEARRRLRDVEQYGNKTIQYIAESVGFTSTSAFNAAFKKFTGMTPALYQKMSKDEQ